MVLDGLIGPWLEAIIEGLYRVSPLLRSLGTDVNGLTWRSRRTERHRSDPCDVPHCLSPTDVSSILMHATFSRDWPTIATLAYGLLRADAETWCTGR